MKYLRNVNEGSDEKIVSYSTVKNGTEIEIGKHWDWDYCPTGSKKNMISSDWSVYLDGKRVQKFEKLSDAKNYVKSL